MISIIIATYNAAPTLNTTLDSLRAQLHDDFEILVADGGSSDGTLALLDHYRDMITVLEQGPDRGIYDAWNKLIPRARGEWLIFLGADDWLEDPDTLARLEHYLDAIPASAHALSFAFGQTEVMESGQAIEHLGRTPLPANRLDVDADISFGHTGLAHHRSLFTQFGLFNADFPSAGDYEFMLRCAMHPDVQFHHLPMIVAHMASGGVSSSAATRLRHYREMRKARRKLGLQTTPGWLHLALARARILKFLHDVFGKDAALWAANLYRRTMHKVPRKQIG